MWFVWKNPSLSDKMLTMEAQKNGDATADECAAGVSLQAPEAPRNEQRMNRENGVSV